MAGFGISNYEVCAELVLDLLPTHKNDARVLDYGCGAGKIVEILREQNIQAYGCDIYFEGGDHSSAVRKDLWSTVIKKMPNGRIPFSEKYFDVVVNNMVFEHVENLDEVLQEINRVLAPGGCVISVFPDRRILREGHCGIPFLHWFPKKSHLRIYYATMLRLCGFGYFTDGKDARQWSSNFCDWLDKWTYYRSLSELHETFERHFYQTTHLEDRFLEKKFPCSMIKIIPARLKRFCSRYLITLVFLSNKYSLPPSFCEKANETG